MESQQQIHQSLQQRVDDYLRGNPIAFAAEEPKEESLDAIFTLIQRAEEDLKVAQERVDRLKWELEKARS